MIFFYENWKRNRRKDVYEKEKESQLEKKRRNTNFLANSR